MCQAFTRNFAGLFLSRFVLGMVEGPFLPGVFFLMSCWYKRSELPPRIALLYGANMLASAFGGLIAAGIVARMEGEMGRPAWVSRSHYHKALLSGHPLWLFEHPILPD
jgi:MFS family permease